MANGVEPTLDAGRLRLLREVALRGSIAAAARALGLTASAVSQQLTVLEREAGTSLLERGARGVVLTGAGHLLADCASEIQELLASARAELDQLRGAAAGTVRVAAVASAAATVVSDAVAALRETQPAIGVTVVAAEPGRSRDLLLADDVDLAIVDEYDYVPLALPDTLVAKALCDEELVVVAPHGVLRGRGGVRLASLRHHGWVMPPDDAACGTAVRSACRASGFEPAVTWETDDMLLLVRAVAAGHGVTVLPRLAVADDGADVDVRQLREPALRRRLFAVTKSSAASRPVVVAVRDQMEVSASLRPAGRR